MTISLFILAGSALARVTGGLQRVGHGLLELGVLLLGLVGGKPLLV
jgi:hypothetical protein